MVFFTCIIVVIVLYYMQSDGLIYVTIIALIAELINLAMTQTLTKSVEKKIKKKFIKIVKKHREKISAQEKTIQEFEELQEESIKKLHNANLRIQQLERTETPEVKTGDLPAAGGNRAGPPKKPFQEKPPEPNQHGTTEPETDDQESFVDLPAGSNRKQLPI